MPELEQLAERDGESMTLQRASCGRALLGFDPISGVGGKHHLLKPVAGVEMMMSNQPAVTCTCTFSQNEDSSSFYKAVEDRGWSFAMKTHAKSFLLSQIGKAVPHVGMPLCPDFDMDLGMRKSSNKTAEEKLSSKVSEAHFTYCVYIPMKAFHIPYFRMKLSESALTRALAVKNDMDAKDFLDEFGPFASQATYHLGGALFKEVVTRTKEETSLLELLTEAMAKFELKPALEVKQQMPDQKEEQNHQPEQGAEGQPPAGDKGQPSARIETSMEQHLSRKMTAKSESLCKLKQHVEKTIILGPKTAVDEEGLRRKLNEDPSSWAIIDWNDLEDQSSISSMVSVWQLLWDHAQSLDNEDTVMLMKAAQLICNRWMRQLPQDQSSNPRYSSLNSKAAVFLAKLSSDPMLKVLPSRDMTRISILESPPEASLVTLVGKLEEALQLAEGESAESAQRDMAMSHIGYFFRNANMQSAENKNALECCKHYGFDEEGNFASGSQLEMSQLRSMIEELQRIQCPPEEMKRSIPPVWPDTMIHSLIVSSSEPASSSSINLFRFFGDVVVDRDFYHNCNALRSILDCPYAGPSADAQRAAHVEQTAARCFIDCMRHRIDPLKSIFQSPLCNDDINLFFDAQAELTSIWDGEVEGEPHALADAMTADLQVPQRVFPIQLLIQIFQSSDLATQISLSMMLLSQRAAAPLIIPSTQEAGVEVFRHCIEALGFVDVVLQNEQRVCIATDTELPRVVFLSNKEVQASHSALIATLVLQCDFLSRHGQPAKTNQVAQSPVIEVGVGFIASQDINGTRCQCPCLSFHVAGPYLRLQKFVEDVNADIVILELEGDFNCSLPISAPILKWREWGGPEGFNGRKMIIQGQQNYLKDGIAQVLSKHLFQNKERTRSTNRATRTSLVDVCPLLCPPHKLINFKELQVMVEQCTVLKTGTSELILQKSFAREAQEFTELAKLKDNRPAKRVSENRCQKEREIRATSVEAVMSIPLIRVFHGLLTQDSAESRRVGLLWLERTLSMMMRPTLDAASRRVDDTFQALKTRQTHPSAREEYLKAKEEYIAKSIGIHNLWRELCHIFEAHPQNQRDLARRAAQHVLDGFPLEILDGDAGMFCETWVGSVLLELDFLAEREKGRAARIFVLSVMGVQSSGKSTMLNLMFGTQLQTSAGRCTRGVYMQLVPSERAEYDYVLLLDTEGLRSPEYSFGLEPCESRDNLIATLGLLPADASIFMVSNEDDGGLKEILPMVLLAFKGSAIAEKCGGRIKAKMMFVYRSVDTNDVRKLKGNKQKLYECLMEAADKVINMDNLFEELSTVPHREISRFNSVEQESSAPENIVPPSVFMDFRVDEDEMKSDVKCMGSLKRGGVPPTDTPDWAYGEGVVQLREYIHKRVMDDEYEVWSFKQWAEHLARVWDCVCNANFELNFKNTMEYVYYRELQAKLRLPRNALLQKYIEVFEDLEKKIMEMNDQEVEHTTTSLLSQLEESMQDVTMRANKEVKRILSERNWTQWSKLELKKWDQFCERNSEWYKQRVKDMESSVLRFEKVVSNYERRMKYTIVQRIDSGEWKLDQSEEMRRQKFEELFKSILNDAERENPPSANKVSGNVSSRYDEYVDIGVHPKRANVVHRNKKKSENRGCLPGLSSWGQTWELQEWDRMGKRSSSLSGKSSQCPPSREEQDEKEPQLRSTLQAIIDRHLRGLTQYSHLAVDKVIHDTSKTISERARAATPISKEEEEDLRTWVKTTLTEQLQGIQKQWDKDHNVVEKLRRKAKPRLLQFFEARAEGLEAAAMLIKELQVILEDELLEAHKRLVVKKVAAQLGQAQWVVEWNVMRYLLDYHLLCLMNSASSEEAALDRLLVYASNEQHHFEVLTQLLVKQALRKEVLESEWESMLRTVESCLREQAGLVSDCCTVRVFLAELARKLDSEVEPKLATSIRSCISEDVYKDHVLDSDFYHNKVPKLCRSLRQISPFERVEEMREKYAQFVRKKMEERGDDQCKPRCEEVCPLCGSACMYPAGHADTQKHDAIHQPAGLYGNNYYDTNELVEETCLESLNGNRALRLRNGKRITYAKFEEAFAGWAKPTRNDSTSIAVRQCLFKTYQAALVRFYNTTFPGLKRSPSCRLQSSFENFNLEAERLLTRVYNKLRHSFRDEGAWNEISLTVYSHALSH